jgi:hypothetical protein
MYALTLIAFAIFSVIAYCQETQTGIPISRVDYSFSLGNLNSLVTVEFIIDLSCPATKDAWPVLSEVVTLYKDLVKFKIRILPLPYHQQAFILSKAASTVYYFEGDRAAIDFMNHAIEHQELFLNSATVDMSYNEVVKLAAGIATNGTLTGEEYFEGMDSSTQAGSTIEAFTRYEWKYAVTHGYYGTPLYTINGLIVNDLSELDEWKEVLDPLVNFNQGTIEAPADKIYL